MCKCIREEKASSASNMNADIQSVNSDRLVLHQ